MRDRARLVHNYWDYLLIVIANCNFIKIGSKDLFSPGFVRPEESLESQQFHRSSLTLTRQVTSALHMG